MILTAEEYRLLNPADTQADAALELRLRALESAVRAWTHNDFTRRGLRCVCPVQGGELGAAPDWLSVGDTVQITESAYNNGVYDVIGRRGDTAALHEELQGDEYVRVTKVVYPPDVKLGIVSLMKWDAEKRDKVGISSETLSRHSITYADMTGSTNAELGYPKSLLGFLTPYMKARF